MTRLDRYIFRHIAFPSLLAFGVVNFLVVANEIRTYMKELPMALVNLGDISRLSVYFLPYLISYVVPITYLLGILMTFGRLAQQGEITAIKAAGIPLKRIAAPVIAVGALLSILCFVVQDRVQPWALDRAFRIIGVELPMRATLDALPAGVMHQYGDWQVYFGGKDPARGELTGVSIIAPTDDGSEQVYHARSARLVKTAQGHEIVLTQPRVIRGDGSRISAETLTIPVAPPTPKSVRGERNARSLAELLDGERALSEEYQRARTDSAKTRLRKERNEIAERVSLPFAALAVAFVGAPLGVRSRRTGRSHTFATAFCIILVYYLMQMAFDTNAVKMLRTVILNAWVPNLAVMLAGAVLLWRVDRV